MIPVSFITEWSEKAPWVANSFVEQDLIITRALTDIYSDEFLSEDCRNGTLRHATWHACALCQRWKAMIVWVSFGYSLWNAYLR